MVDCLLLGQVSLLSVVSDKIKPEELKRGGY